MPESGGDGRLAVGITPWLDDWDGTAESLAGQAELAEALGFHSFWLPESHFTGPSSNPAPLLRLAVVAARTRRLGVGTTSFLLPVRHPIHVAEEVAVLDRLSGGRVILGVGRGFRSALFAAFDVPAREKRDRFEAALELIRSAWLGRPLAREPGDEPSPVHLAPLPLQKPHPPIWVAAFGPKAVAQAGRLGLPYLASPIETVASLEENYARHRDALPEPDARRAVPVMRTVYTSRDVADLARAHELLTRQARALARASAQSIRRVAHAEVDDWAIVGEPAAVADRIAEYRERLGMTHLIVRAQVPNLSAEAHEASIRLLAETLL
jgi:alkanesulfonate monooxygenase SsuD/methylene tetrahydromethanopterin reductase-like flavin-dependent oxidoreductase (luciferase family)